jgi:hypothetical protein
MHLSLRRMNQARRSRNALLGRAVETPSFSQIESIRVRLAPIGIFSLQNLSHIMSIGYSIIVRLLTSGPLVPFARLSSISFSLLCDSCASGMSWVTLSSPYSSILFHSNGPPVSLPRLYPHQSLSFTYRCAPNNARISTWTGFRIHSNVPVHLLVVSHNLTLHPLGPALLLYC